MQPLPYRDAHELVVLSSNGQAGTQAPSIRLADYREWTTDTAGLYTCNFLGWAGTELMCASGHGLLHIPELPTSWFGTQRWLCLDPSWLCLFAEQPSTSAEV